MSARSFGAGRASAVRDAAQPLVQCHSGSAPARGDAAEPPDDARQIRSRRGAAPHRRADAAGAEGGEGNVHYRQQRVGQADPPNRRSDVRTADRARGAVVARRVATRGNHGTTPRHRGCSRPHAGAAVT